MAADKKQVPKKQAPKPTMTAVQLAKKVQAIQAKRLKAEVRIKELDAKIGQLDEDLARLLEDTVACV